MADSNRFIPLSMEDSEYPGNTGPKTRELDKLTGPLAPIRKPVTRLRELQAKQRRLEKEYQNKLQDLERWYFTESKPLYEERAKVVIGDEDLGDGPFAGVPDFWLNSMGNHPAISGLIRFYDLDALGYLTNIRLEHVEHPERGFQLLFDFAENEFFTNRTLSKMYTYVGDDNAGLFYGEVIGDTVLWKSRREIPPELQGQTPFETFFDFFNPPQYPPSDGQNIDLIEMKITLDYKLGEVFKEELIPNAVDWFTREAKDEEEEWIWNEEHRRHYRQIGIDNDGNPVCEWDIGQRKE